MADKTSKPKAKAKKSTAEKKAVNQTFQSSWRN